MTGRRVENGIVTVVTLVAAAIWFFPLYWAIVTSLRTDESVVAGAGLIPDQFELGAYIERALQHQAPDLVPELDRHRRRSSPRSSSSAA